MTYYFNGPGRFVHPTSTLTIGPAGERSEFSIYRRLRRTHAVFQYTLITRDAFRLMKFLRCWVHPHAEGLPSCSDDTPGQTTFPSASHT